MRTAEQIVSDYAKSYQDDMSYSEDDFIDGINDAIEERRISLEFILKDIPSSDEINQKAIIDYKNMENKDPKYMQSYQIGVLLSSYDILLDKIKSHYERIK